MRGGRLGVWQLGLAAVVAVSAACSTGSQGTSGRSATGPSGAAASSGGTTGTASAAASTGSGPSSSGGELTTSGSSSTGTTSGGTTGGPDAGCPVGAPGGLTVGAVCYFAFDCGCGLACAADVAGGGSNKICQYPCAANSDCPLNAEACDLDAGLCLGGLYGSCSPPSGVDLEFYACNTNVDCPCPLECYADPVLGKACEFPCDSDPICAGREYCNLGMGSCQQSCGPGATATEFQACGKPTDCLCPLSCFGDARRGQVCETPCQGDADCADAGELCETDAGACQPAFDCYGGDGGLPAFSVCSHL